MFLGETTRVLAVRPQYITYAISSMRLVHSMYIVTASRTFQGLLTVVQIEHETFRDFSVLRVIKCLPRHLSVILLRAILY